MSVTQSTAHAKPDWTINEDISVTVSICTFRRRSVIDAIKSVSLQRLPKGVDIEVIVVDNDDTPSAKTLVDDYCATGNVVRYLHVPGRNISIARNAALDATQTPWLAFLDDDEFAASDWLFGLLSARTGAAAVFGPSQAIYCPMAPNWMKKSDCHSNRIHTGHKTIISGHTCNVLIDMEFIRKHRLRFDLALGRSGGEDSQFFYAVYRKGGTLRYVHDAAVFEPVPRSRMTLRWLAARRFRAGQVYAMMFRDLDRAKYWSTAATAPLKVAICACSAVGAAFSASRAMSWFLRGIFHLGFLSFVMGAPLHEESSLTNRDAV